MELRLSPGIPRYLATLFHQFIPPLGPTDVYPLFVTDHQQFNVSTWHYLLLDQWEKTTSCKLERIEYCKEQRNKLREFLVLHFSHPIQRSARAAVIVDFEVEEDSPISPGSSSQPATRLVDVVGQEENLKTWLTSAYGKYEVLRALEYTPTSASPQPPSVIQLSALFEVLHQHSSDHHIYVHSCHCYVHLVFEACKELFLGSHEDCYCHATCSQCSLEVEMFHSSDLRLICQIYERNWKELVQRRTEEEVRREHEEMRRAYEENCRACKETRKAYKAYKEKRRAYKEEYRAYKEEYRAYEEECRACEEERRAYKEERRKFDQGCRAHTARKITLLEGIKQS